LGDLDFEEEPFEVRDRGETGFSKLGCDVRRGEERPFAGDRERRGEEEREEEEDLEERRGEDLEEERRGETTSVLVGWFRRGEAIEKEPEPERGGEAVLVREDAGTKEPD